MNKNEKKIVICFLNHIVPNCFVDSIDKLLFDEFIKGHCTVFVKTSKISKSDLSVIISNKNLLFNGMSFKNDDDIIYFDMMRLVISIFHKYAY